MIAHSLRRRITPAALPILLALLIAAIGMAADDVSLNDKSIKRNVAVLAENYDGIAIDTNADGKADVAVPTLDVKKITYGDRPLEFGRAESAMRNGRYAQAVELFGVALAKKDVRRFWIEPHVNANMGDCYLIMAQTDAKLYDKAIQHFNAVVQNHPKAARTPDAMRGLARCYVAKGDRDKADALLEKLSSGSYGNQYVLLATVDMAKLKADKKSPDETVALTGKALKMADNPQYESVALDARLGCADALTATGKGDAAYNVLRDMASNYDEREVDIQARIFNAIGDSLLAQNKLTDALMAYLRVRVLYFRSEDELPRALYGTALCFRARKEGARANAVVKELLDKHTDTKWAEMARKEFPGVK